MSSENPSLKILVAYHKPAVLFKDEVLTPIHAGRAVAQEASKDGDLSPEHLRWMTENMIGDDTGDNISRLNRHYSEFTVLYWAWKNYDKLGSPDYIGFMHYRRIFDFSSPKHHKLPAGQRVADTAAQIAAKARQTLQNHDFISVQARDLREWKAKSITEYFQSFPPCIHPPQMLPFLREEIKNKHPDLLKEFDGYFNGPFVFFNTMFILPRQTFFDFCQFIFPLLEKFHAQHTAPDASVTGRRAPSYVGEYLTGFYLHCLSKRQNAAFIPQLFLTHTDSPADIRPAFTKNNAAVLFSSDDKFAPYLGVCIQSLLDHASEKRNYDLLVLEENISSSVKNKLLSLCNAKSNVSLRFIPIEPWMRNLDKKCFHTFGHYTQATYYRLFVSDILSRYDKILYLDTDTVLCRDAADLFDTDLGDKLIAAAHDAGVSCRLRQWPHLKEYIKNTLLLPDVNSYLQAGVLLMNLKQMRRENFGRQVLDALKTIPKPMYVDQDIINYLCKNRAIILPLKWNVLWAIPFFITDWNHLMPASVYNEYVKARRNPALIHYGGPKPWQQPWRDMADIFWKHARQTPFYEEIIYRNMSDEANRAASAKPPVQPTPKNWEPLIALAAAYPHNLWHYYRSKVLSKITWGKKRAHYKQKRNALHEKVRGVRKWFK